MNWKYFLPIPLAALAVAKPLHAPVLRASIPLSIRAPCDYAWALRQYLQAYAYSRENKALALRLNLGAETELQRCPEAAEILLTRVRGLRQTLFP